MGESVVIPRRRVQLEARLAWAIDQGPRAIVDVLPTFSWSAHRELACLGLAEIARQQRPVAGELAVTVASWCGSAAGPYCQRCPVRSARA